jgi:folylpolyglutamate synthase
MTPLAVVVVSRYSAFILLNLPTAGSGSEGAWRPHAAVLLFNCMKERDPTVLLPALAAALEQGLKPEASTSQGASSNRADSGTPTIEVEAAIFTPMLSGGGVLLPGSTSKKPDGPPPQQQPPEQRQPASAPPHRQQQQPVDLTWQACMRDAWGSATTAAASRTGQVAAATTGAVAPGLLGGQTAEDVGSAVSVSGAGSVGRLQGLPRASVAIALPPALDAIREAAVADPRVHLHVLVTGSLYLVGDVLRLLNKPPA